MKIIVTGAAGFIGSHLVDNLLKRGDEVIGIDNHNDYYDPQLKEARIKRHNHHPKYNHYRVDIMDRKSIDEVFSSHRPHRVVNLAAQAGVRFSIKNPLAYIDSNIYGFTNVLECCRYYSIEHLVYASSSSVYGGNTLMPFSVHQNIDHPLSLYAATKKSNELMAHTYSHLYNLPTTGLRFFTVYGPWGRPDMAYYKFTKAILQSLPIDVYNNGNHRRDFTYIDDIVDGIVRVLDSPATENLYWDSDKPDPSSSRAPWRIYNIGNNNPIELMEMIRILEKILGRKARLNFLPLQPGDVPDTYANIDDLVNEFGFMPSTSLEKGINQFVDWYLRYYEESKMTE